MSARLLDPIPTVESAKGWDLGKRFTACICIALFALAGCGPAAPRDAGIVPGAQTPAVTPAPALLASASVTAAPTAPTPSPATAVTQAPATTAPATQPPAPAAPVTQAPATRAPATAAPTPKPVVVFTSVKSPVSRNSTGSVTVSTAPNVSCTITVTYKSGPSEAQGLVPKMSSAAGAATWTWNIGPSTTFGTWPIDVTCGGATGRATFVVQ